MPAAGMFRQLFRFLMLETIAYGLLQSDGFGRISSLQWLINLQHISKK